MTFRTFLSSSLVRLDGGMGTLLQARGLTPGEMPERWCLSHPEIITEIHRAYYDAGSNVVSTNTFGASLLKLSPEELDAIVGAAVACAREAAATSTREGSKFVALDIGPSGKLLRPLGDLDFEDAVSLFAATVRAGVKHGVDLILIETMNDAYETKAALLAARENSDLPVIVTNAYGADGKLLTGATPEAMVALLEGMGADAIGANCSLGPHQLAGVVHSLLSAASVPVVLKPNAGLPRIVDGRTVFDVTAETFAEEVATLVRRGVRVFGGCCGTTPAYIEALTRATATLTPLPIRQKQETVISSYTHAVRFGDGPLLIGERINPTGKKRFREALLSHDMTYILAEAVREEEAGVHILDVNVGLPEIDEVAMLTEAVTELQAVTALPLCIDSADPAAMEAALRRYNGKPLINSVSAKEESLAAILPLVKKYGGVVIALTLDEAGIPETAEGRIAIAERILAAAASYGIAKKDIVFDTLALTVSADKNAAIATLRALHEIRNTLGCHTSLGVSNVSFGLPARDAINATFFSMALSAGLSAAIMNPQSLDMQKTYHAFRVLTARDESCAGYIAAAERFAATTPAPSTPNAAIGEEGSPLHRAILKGLRQEAAKLTEGLLATTPALAIVDTEIIPALNAVGKAYERGALYLPGLLISAEAAGAAFAVIRAGMSEKKEKPAERGPFVLATVKGDIHDIGKNIVRLILENYGYRVIDLGRDVPPEEILRAVLAHHAPLCGLSALMTTTTPAMKETVALLRKEAPFCHTVVGGAVLTAEYAAAIGADCYAPDPMEAVRYAETVLA